MVRSIRIRVHPLFADALEQMRIDLEKFEKQIFYNPELTRRIALRMKQRRKFFAKRSKVLE